MSTIPVPPSTRTGQVLSAAGLGLLTAALVVSPAIVSPASAALDCDGLAANAADYQAELGCASLATEGEQTITLTDSFAVPATAQNTYYGAQPLTVEGAHDGVTISGPGQDTVDTQDGTGKFLEITQGQVGMGLQEVPLDEVSVGAELEALPDMPADVTVRNLTLTDFSSAGVIANSTYGQLSLSQVEVVDNGVLATPGGQGGFPAGAAVAVVSDLIITDSLFEGNAGALGGAVSNWLVFMAPGPGDEEPQGPPTISVSGSTFIGNEAVSGAGIFSVGNTEVTDSSFSANVAETGGAVASFGPVATVTGSDFVGNVATSLSPAEGYIEGGALAVDGVVTISDSEFLDNASDGIGGAVAFSVGDGIAETSLAITDSVLDGNASEDAGGAVWFEGGVTIDGSTFVDNASMDGPAAMAVTGAGEDVFVTNSTFASNNSAAPAPALAVAEAGAVAVTHSTFSGNASAGTAADLAVYDTSSTTLIASVWGSGAVVPSCEIEGELTTAATFDVDGSCTDGWSGTGDIGEGLDPQLGALADNGGATPTLLPAASSPLVDAVADGASDTSADQRGVARPQGDAKDIGAVEIEPDLEPGAGLIEFQVPTDSGILYGTANPALAVTDIAWIPTGDLGTPPPADTALPYGAAGFTVDVPQPGDTVEITLTAPRPFTTLLKSTDGVWSEVDGATFSNNGTTVTYTLTDGGELDEDGEVNGRIVDPVALAVQATFTG